MNPKPLRFLRRCPDCLEVETATAGDQCKKGCSERVVFLDEDVANAVKWLKIQFLKPDAVYPGTTIITPKRAYELIDEAFPEVDS